MICALFSLALAIQPAQPVKTVEKTAIEARKHPRKRHPFRRKK